MSLHFEAAQFLQIFKVFKIVHLLADTFGEIFIDSKVKQAVQITFADGHLKPLSVVNFLKMDHLVKETVHSFRLEAQLPIPPHFFEPESGDGLTMI